MRQRTGFRIAQIIAVGWVALSARTAAQSLPPDVRAGYWAATPVQVVLRNHILSVEADKGFHGDTKVTHLEAVLALARLGRALEAGTWQGSASVPITVAKTDVAPKSGTWEKQGVSRYVFATVLTHMADYVSSGVVRAQPTDKDTGKSVVIPPVAVTLPKSSPAYEALTYLASRRMIAPGSALLAADDKPLNASQMSRALRDFVTGLNDRVTDLGHDADGATHDEAFHPKNPAKKN